MKLNIERKLTSQKKIVFQANHAFLIIFFAE